MSSSRDRLQQLLDGDLSPEDIAEDPALVSLADRLYGIKIAPARPKKARDMVDNPVAARYPTPLEVTANDDILVGRIRVDREDPHRLWLWQVGDNLRKGAATNAVQTAEAWLNARSPPRSSA